MLSRPYRVELNLDVQEPMEFVAAATQAKIPDLPKIVFSSTAAVYGMPERVPIPVSAPRSRSSAKA